MTAAVAGPARLAQLARALRRRDLALLDLADTDFLAGAIEEWLSRGGSLEAALGVQTAQSERKPATISRMAARDAWIRHAARFFPTRSRQATAKALAAELHTYSTGAWTTRPERCETRCPPRNIGTAREAFWHALKMHDHAIRWPSVERILGERAGEDADRRARIAHDMARAELGRFAWRGPGDYR